MKERCEKAGIKECRSDDAYRIEHIQSPTGPLHCVDAGQRAGHGEWHDEPMHTRSRICDSAAQCNDGYTKCNDCVAEVLASAKG